MPPLSRLASIFGEEPSCITWTSLTVIFQRCSIISSTEWDTAPMRVTPTRLPFKIRRSFDFRFRHESLQTLVDYAGDHHGIAAAQRRGDQDIACRIHHLYVVGEQRADAGGATLAGDNHFGIDAVLCERALLFPPPIPRCAARSPSSSRPAISLEQ